MSTTIQEMRVSDLRPHPENERIYRDKADNELVESVREKGVINPLLITHDRRIINGHRRWDAARRVGLATVTVLVFPSDDELDIVEALIECNRQRQKTNEQIGREAQALLEIETEKARRRMAVEISHLVLKPDVKGNARDIVGEKLGYGGRHVEQAAAVVEVIDDLEGRGKTREAAQLRATLNQNVARAHQVARDNGHIKVTARPAPAPKPAEYITVDQWQAMSEPERFQTIHGAESHGKFNDQKEDSIEWALWSWNPVTGCLHNCDYCYARDIAERFYPQKFAPSLMPSRLGIPYAMKVPPEAQNNIGYKNVFTCSMADLFGKWVPAEWIEAVLTVVKETPQWNYLFLTKFPSRMSEFVFPDNAWVGTTVDRQYAVERAEKAFRNIKAAVKFLSCEPLLEPLQFTSLEMFDWVIVGGSSKSTQTPEFRPPREWINGLEQQARDAGCRLYEKANLLERIKEYPGQ